MTLSRTRISPVSTASCWKEAMRMVDSAIVKALVRTVFSIPHGDWTAADLDLIKEHLEGSLELKGLTRVSEIVVRDLVDTLEKLKEWKGPEPSECLDLINQMFKTSEEESSSVQVDVLAPNVTVAKCLSLSLRHYSHRCMEQGLSDKEGCQGLLVAPVNYSSNRTDIAWNEAYCIPSLPAIQSVKTSSSSESVRDPSSTSSSHQPLQHLSPSMGSVGAGIIPGVGALSSDPCASQQNAGMIQVALDANFPLSIPDSKFSISILDSKFPISIPPASNEDSSHHDHVNPLPIVENLSSVSPSIAGSSLSIPATSLPATPPASPVATPFTPSPVPSTPLTQPTTPVATPPITPPSTPTSDSPDSFPLNSETVSSVSLFSANYNIGSGTLPSIYSKEWLDSKASSFDQGSSNLLVSGNAGLDGKDCSLAAKQHVTSKTSNVADEALVMGERKHVGTPSGVVNIDVSMSESSDHETQSKRKDSVGNMVHGTLVQPVLSSCSHYAREPPITPGVGCITGDDGSSVPSASEETGNCGAGSQGTHLAPINTSSHDTSACDYAMAISELSASVVEKSDCKEESMPSVNIEAQDQVDTLKEDISPSVVGDEPSNTAGSLGGSDFSPIVSSHFPTDHQSATGSPLTDNSSSALSSQYMDHTDSHNCTPKSSTKCSTNSEDLLPITSCDDIWPASSNRVWPTSTPCARWERPCYGDDTFDSCDTDSQEYYQPPPGSAGVQLEPYSSDETTNDLSGLVPSPIEKGIKSANDDLTEGRAVSVSLPPHFISQISDTTSNTNSSKGSDTITPNSSSFSFVEKSTLNSVSVECDVHGSKTKTRVEATIALIDEGDYFAGRLASASFGSSVSSSVDVDPQSPAWYNTSVDCNPVEGVASSQPTVKAAATSDRSGSPGTTTTFTTVSELSSSVDEADQSPSCLMAAVGASMLAESLFVVSDCEGIANDVEGFPVCVSAPCCPSDGEKLGSSQIPVDDNHNTLLENAGNFKSNAENLKNVEHFESNAESLNFCTSGVARSESAGVNIVPAVGSEVTVVADEDHIPVESESLSWSSGSSKSSLPLSVTSPYHQVNVIAHDECNPVVSASGTPEPLALALRQESWEEDEEEENVPATDHSPQSAVPTNSDLSQKEEADSGLLAVAGLGQRLEAVIRCTSPLYSEGVNFIFPSIRDSSSSPVPPCKKPLTADDWSPDVELSSSSVDRDLSRNLPVALCGSAEDSSSGLPAGSDQSTCTNKELDVGMKTSICKEIGSLSGNPVDEHKSGNNYATKGVSPKFKSVHAYVKDFLLKSEQQMLKTTSSSQDMCACAVPAIPAGSQEEPGLEENCAKTIELEDVTTKYEMPEPIQYSRKELLSMESVRQPMPQFSQCARELGILKPDGDSAEPSNVRSRTLSAAQVLCRSWRPNDKWCSNEGQTWHMGRKHSS